MTYPITHPDGTTDRRYTVSLEWCGHPKQRHVLRYCGEWIDSFSNAPAATLRAVGHRNAASGAAIFTEQPPVTAWELTRDYIQSKLDEASA